MPFKVGVDVTPLETPLTGIGNYIYYLLKELIKQHPETFFYLYARRRSPLLNQLADKKNVRLRVHPFGGLSAGFWGQTTLAWMCAKDHLDIFWGSTQAFPLFARKKQKNVITIYDFAYHLFPRTVSLGRRYYLRMLGKRFYNTAALRIAISHGTAERMKKIYDLPAHGVITPPLKNLEQQEIIPLLQALGLQKGRYFLLLGTLEPRKNIEKTLKTYISFLDKELLDPLLIIGKKGWNDASIQKQLSLAQKHYPSHIKWLDYLTDRQLNGYVKNARAYLMPSLYEGYGMPIAEARTLGTPVICTASPEMIEAAEGDAFFLREKHFIEDLHKALTTSLPPPKSPTYPSCSSLAQSFFTLISGL